MTTPIAILFIVCACLGIAYIVRRHQKSAEKRVNFLNSIEKAPVSEWDRNSTRYDLPELNFTPKEIEEFNVRGFKRTNRFESSMSQDEIKAACLSPDRPLRAMGKTTATQEGNCLYLSEDDGYIPISEPQRTYKGKLPLISRQEAPPIRLEDFSSTLIASAIIEDAYTPSEPSFTGGGGDFGGGGASDSWDSGSSSDYSSSSSYDSGSSGGGCDSGSSGCD